MNAVRRTFPQIYREDDQLKIDPASCRVPTSGGLPATVKEGSRAEQGDNSDQLEINFVTCRVPGSASVPPPAPSAQG